MATSRKPNPLRTVNKEDQPSWLHLPWMEGADSVVKLQRIWLDICNDAARHELEFLTTMASSYSKLTTCMLNFGGQHTPESMASCYQEVADDMAEATLKRMRRVSELNDELKERIWCEI